MTRAVTLLQGVLLGFLLGPAQVLAQADDTPRLVCPCSIYSSGAVDSNRAPMEVIITAGVENLSGSTTGPLRLLLVAHDTPSMFQTDLVYDEVSIVRISSGLESSSCSVIQNEFTG